MLHWHPLVTSYDQKFLVKGTELSMAIVPGHRSRFAIIEVRCLDADGHSDRLYRIRDAETVTDDEVRMRVRPHIVFEGGFDEALAWCAKH